MYISHGERLKCSLFYFLFISMEICDICKETEGGICLNIISNNLAPY